MSTNKRLYNIYHGIKRRCEDSKRKEYQWYGFRWIKCCRKTYKDFENDMWSSYYKHVEEYGEKNTTIDRIDNDWDYCKENCRRATLKEQWNNQRKSWKTRYGMSMQDIIDKYKITPKQLKRRCDRLKYDFSAVINYFETNKNYPHW